MKKTRATFEERVPVVLNLIREAEKPIGFTELYNRLREKTGEKISKTTFNKCLDYLSSTCDINKTYEKGRGGPVKYSVNQDYFIYKTAERIDVSSYLLKYFSENSSPYGTEANLWSVLSEEISDIVISLVLALSHYSQGKNKLKAINDYNNTIEAEIVPHLLKLPQLVNSPIKMTSFTVYILFKLFHENIVDSAKKPHHPFMSLTPEEKEKIDYLVNEKIVKSGIVFKEEVPKSFDLSHIEDSEFIKEYIKYVEMKSEAFFEIRKYEDNGTEDKETFKYPNIKSENFFKVSMNSARFPNTLRKLVEKDTFQPTQDQLNDLNLDEIINKRRK